MTNRRANQNKTLLSDLRGIVPADHIADSDSTKNVYGRDWTRFFQVNCLAVAFPESTDEVQTLVRWARRHRVPLVPSGGRTGLSGGAVASGGELVISLEKMNRILNWNATEKLIHCQAGAITETIQNFAKEKGSFFPVDFAAKGSSQIGGNIATNAGGVKVLRYGSTRNWVAGLTAVDGRGEILHCPPLVKNATGYDFRHLLIGSEGTLAIVTEAVLRTTQPPADLVVALLGVDELSKVMDLFHRFQSLPLTTFEFFSNLALNYVRAQTGLPQPLQGRAQFYVLVEFELVHENTMSQAEEIFGEALEAGTAQDGTIAQSETQARQLWRYRENISESLAPHTPYKNDISVGIAQIPAFLKEADAIIKREHPNWNIVWFGHIGDGNLHINILKPDSLPTDEFVRECRRADENLFKVIEKYHGSISAEHGVGLIKKPFLHHTRSSAEIELMKQIKAAFDPDGILNPGKIFD